MPQLINKATGQYPIKVEDFMKSLPYLVPFNPATLEEYNHEVVFDVPKPQLDKLWTVTESTSPIRCTKGFLEQTWLTVDTYASMSADSQARTLADVKTEVKSQLATLRWNKETGGLTLPDGTKVKTDEVSQAKIHAALTGLTNGYNTVITFKSDSGTVLLGLPEITALSQAVWTYVQACFVQEAALVELIDACLNPHDVYALDLNAGWPSNSLVPPPAP